MNKIQKVKFNSIGEFFDFLPEKEKEIVAFLRTIITDSIPGYKEKLAYNVPYYYRYSRICFIWPSSVPWGNVKKDGVLLGFCRGSLLHDDLNYLEKGNRKHVYTKTFMNIDEINVDIVKTYLFEAIEIDERMRKK